LVWLQCKLFCEIVFVKVLDLDKGKSRSNKDVKNDQETKFTVKVNELFQNIFLSLYTFLICFFWFDLTILAVFIIFVLFCQQVVRLIHLVFRQTGELNSCPRTMAQTVSPRHSPLDQAASPILYILDVFSFSPFIIFSSLFCHVTN
jgi:hypothetical protein